MISSADDNTLIIWEANTMALEQIISFASSQVNAIIFSPDGNKMITADSQCSLSVFRMSDFKLT